MRSLTGPASERLPADPADGLRCRGLALASVFVATIATCFASSGVAQCSLPNCAPMPHTALAFDGIDDVVTIAPNPALDGLQDFTIEAWTNATGPVSTHHVVLASDSNAAGYQRSYWLGFGTGATTGWIPRLLLNYPGFTLVSPVQVSLGAWHHIAVTRTGLVVQMLVDGTPIASGTYGALLTSITPSLKLGGDAVAQRFAGSLDEIRIWNIGRTQAQIQSTMCFQIAGNEPGLVGYWRFDENVGQTAANQSTSFATTAPPSLLNGTLGANALLGTDDPAWTATAAPLLSCGCPPGATPQPNSTLASLTVNGIGGATSPGVYPPGPFYVTVPTTGPSAWQVSFSWAGPPGSTLVVANGLLQPCAIDLGCNGRLDLAFPTLNILFDGTMAPLNLFFTLGPTGIAVQSFTLPALPPGVFISLQGGVIQSGLGCLVPVKMTAAFQLST